MSYPGASFDALEAELANRAYLREDTPKGATYRHFQLVAPSGEVIRGMNAATARRYGFTIDGTPE